MKRLVRSSAGVVWCAGRPDGGNSRYMALAHLREIFAATDLPVNADFQYRFAHDPQEVTKASDSPSRPV
jgi:2-methylisocitrate lyase-like PEP mutase family enzyme